MSTGPVSFYPTHLDVCRADPVTWTPHEIGRFLHNLGLQNVEFDQWHTHRSWQGKNPADPAYCNRSGVLNRNDRDEIWPKIFQLQMILQDFISGLKYFLTQLRKVPRRSRNVVAEMDLAIIWAEAEHRGLNIYTSFHLNFWCPKQEAPAQETQDVDTTRCW